MHLSCHSSGLNLDSKTEEVDMELDFTIAFSFLSLTFHNEYHFNNSIMFIFISFNQLFLPASQPYNQIAYKYQPTCPHLITSNIHHATPRPPRRGGLDTATSIRTIPSPPTLSPQKRPHPKLDAVHLLSVPKSQSHLRHHLQGNPNRHR